jgi:hypothetical protein
MAILSVLALLPIIPCLDFNADPSERLQDSRERPGQDKTVYPKVHPDARSAAGCIAADADVEKQ